MEEDPAQVEHEQVDHDEGINEERFQRSIALDKPKRERKKPKKYRFDQDEVNYALNVTQGDLTTYQEDIASDDRESWMVAMSEEIQSLDKNSRFDSYILKINFRRCLKDCCVYYHVFEDGMIILLLLYVDDMLIACQDISRIQKLKTQLSKEFDMKDLVAAQKILGMQIRRDKIAGKIWLSQAKYIQNILERFNMNEAKLVTTPLADYQLSVLQCPTTEKELEEMSKMPYASVVGCLLYAMVCTRPDLAQTLSTKSLGILFEKQGKEACVLGYVDADYARDLDKRSTTVWLNGLAREFGITQGSMVIRCDSQSAIYLAKNQVFHGRSKHIEAHYHRIRDWVESKEVTLEKVHTKENASDYLTKPVTAEKFKFCLNSLNLITC
ncbi:hypothetical protein EZV62_019094 [Acer yangbiense]|uniref:Reverse transcriptase Ty1/copia-type domain-containing protein n=1 Tax=Acer yangbiense TaxID=1000413 RepID=A0A5C7HA53_9ROSI|nr:hypothetical protein EZV62_019094 [Acer yangbiense]